MYAPASPPLFLHTVGFEGNFDEKFRCMRFLTGAQDLSMCVSSLTSSSLYLERLLCASFSYPVPPQSGCKGSLGEKFRFI